MMTLQELFNFHFDRYPAMQISDVYKLLHQANFGSSHATSRKQATQEWLELELAKYPAQADAPLLESVSLRGETVRLYLPVYKALGGAVKPLLAAVIQSKGVREGDDQTIAEQWAAFVAMVEADPALARRFDLREVRLFGRAITERHWAVMHHSPVYWQTYTPVYRVLTLEQARRVCDGQGIAIAS